MYCVDLYSRFNKLEIDREILLGKASDAPRAVAFRLRGLGNQKNRLDHRNNDSRAVSSCVCLLLSDSNKFFYVTYPQWKKLLHLRCIHQNLYLEEH